MVNLSVIFDIGQFSSKVGFGGENTPRSVFYSLTGVPKYTSIEVGATKQIYVGNEVIDSIGLYKITYPIDKGEIIDWEMFEALINYAFYALRVDPSTVNILYALNPFVSDATKQRLFKLFLEKYQAMGFYPVRSALLTMYSGGFNTGVVVDIGVSATRITPIYEGFIIPHAIQSIPYGGNVLDSFLKNRLSDIGISIESSGQRELVRVLKERACFISLNYDEDLKHADRYREDYSMPDGTVFSLGKDRFDIPELFFKPVLGNLECDPLHQAILKCIDACDITIRSALLERIFLIGGSSMFSQFDVRLKQEIEEELNRQGRQQQTVHIIAPSERHFANWIGGSILSMIPEFQSNWITRAQYYKDGIPPNLLE